jgi:hypothetical protein
MKTFNLTIEHIKLLQAMYVDWHDCEFGAPTINPKRPYGNSDVLWDIAEILGIESKKDKNDEFYYTDKEEKYMNKLHEETQTALQIVLRTGEFEVGEYEADDYKENWKRKW